MKIKKITTHASEIEGTKPGQALLGQGEKTMMTARQHALLFAFISKSVTRDIGVEKGEPLIRKAVREYGRQRGKRMALRAKKCGHGLISKITAYPDMDFKILP